MVDSYSKRISDIIYDTKNYEIEVQFYLTQHCNLGCRGCYMRSSPNAPRNVLPYDDLNFYLNQFDNVPNFTNMVTFSGGEIFTASINYVRTCANMVLDRGWGLQLKTNGAWVMDTQKCADVMNMLQNLQPGRGMVADEKQIHDFLRRYPKWLLRVCGRWLLMRKMPTTSMLSMAVSVDDKLHPVQSADWFVKIADLITNDKKLRNRVNLKTFTVADSVPLLESRVLNNPKLNIENFEKMPGKWAARYTINGVMIRTLSQP